MNFNIGIIDYQDDDSGVRHRGPGGARLFADAEQFVVMAVDS